ncbi:hypothetical protein QBC40DRAFT_314396 [Triangularia verruculosa]|uniref:Uncharacterized protein n=1 Tax=Triangularia verruculosa TaxID=2587418 RepID=A0AAN6XSP4_9PEZI|nr:hypothetical protein QBC40DRAFT_314396 [Triangularia verruculosa]
MEINTLNLGGHKRPVLWEVYRSAVETGAVEQVMVVPVYAQRWRKIGWQRALEYRGASSKFLGRGKLVFPRIAPFPVFFELFNTAASAVCACGTVPEAKPRKTAPRDNGSTSRATLTTDISALMLIFCYATSRHVCTEARRSGPGYPPAGSRIRSALGRDTPTGADGLTTNGRRRKWHQDTNVRCLRSKVPAPGSPRSYAIG